jgi:endoglucanase
VSRLPAILAGFALLANSCAAPVHTDQGSGAANPTSPLAADAFYLDPNSPAAQQEAAWREAGRAVDANHIDKIARRPQAKWLTADPARVAAETRDLISRAATAHQTAVLVAYNIPHRDCGGFSSGGARDTAAYRTWIDAVIHGIGDAHPVVVLEPDAVPDTLSGCLPAPQRNERIALLAEAGAALSRHGARVYLDAGHPRWINDTTALTGALRDAGITQLAGFSLNVSNFYPTAEVTAYGHELSGKLGNAHFIVDTSRNGNGTALGSDPLTWCNPPNRALGQPPTTTTGDPQLDALLWIKNPGISDGACRSGEPPAGRWWPDYALGLAQRAH